MKANIYFKNVRWNADATRLFASATGPDPTYTVAEMQSEVRNGHSSLLAVFLEAKGAKPLPLGYIIMWRDDFGSGVEAGELVIQAGAAFTNTLAKLALVAPAFDQLARNHNCTTIRTHVSDPAFLAAWKRHGFTRREVVMTRRVK